MVASIIYKYVREAMFKPKTVTQTVVDEFGLPKTMIHRQLFGKKYPGGGQTLAQLRKEDKKVAASGSGTRKVAVIFKKSKTDADTKAQPKKIKKLKMDANKETQSKKVEKSKTGADTEAQSKKGKGAGKKSGKKRSAEDIRGAATAQEEKRKREIKK